MLPLAPGANGQPPSPPTEASSRVTPERHRRVRAGQTGAAGVVEVRAQRDVADQRAHVRDQVGDPPRRGGADGVGDREPVDAASHAAVTMSTTRWGGVGPSNGQSHAVAMMTSTEAPLSWAIATISAISAVASAVERPTLARLCPSAADTTYSIEPRPAAMARLAPLGLATSAENSMPEIPEIGAVRRRVRRRRPARAPSTARRRPSPPSPARRWRRRPPAVRAWRTTGLGPRSAARRAARRRECRHVVGQLGHSTPSARSAAISSSVLPSRSP